MKRKGRARRRSYKRRRVNSALRIEPYLGRISATPRPIPGPGSGWIKRTVRIRWDFASTENKRTLTAGTFFDVIKETNPVLTPGSKLVIKVIYVAVWNLPKEPGISCGLSLESGILNINTARTFIDYGGTTTMPKMLVKIPPANRKPCTIQNNEPTLMCTVSANPSNTMLMYIRYAFQF